MSSEASAAARLRPEHTLTWAVRTLVTHIRATDATVYRDEAELISSVRDVVTLAPNYGAASFVDHGDELSLAYLVALRATDGEIAALVNS